ncbi:MAG: hypothetical protein AAF742_03350, partial [Pseudomonadota bacterium]
QPHPLEFLNKQTAVLGRRTSALALPFDDIGVAARRLMRDGHRTRSTAQNLMLSSRQQSLLPA